MRLRNLDKVFCTSCVMSYKNECVDLIGDRDMADIKIGDLPSYITVGSDFIRAKDLRVNSGIAKVDGLLMRPVYDFDDWRCFIRVSVSNSSVVAEVKKDGRIEFSDHSINEYVPYIMAVGEICGWHGARAICRAVTEHIPSRTFENDIKAIRECGMFDTPELFKLTFPEEIHQDIYRMLMSATEYVSATEIRYIEDEE